MFAVCVAVLATASVGNLDESDALLSARVIAKQLPETNGGVAASIPVHIPDSELLPKIAEVLENMKDEFKGDQGEVGPKGDKGDPGDDGTHGNHGVDGEKGEKGDSGADGTHGNHGKDGEKGEKGDSGVNGNHGIDGQHGAKGDKGDQGDDGVDGEKGEKGDSGVNGNHGNDGNHGTDGRDGAKGDKGDQGNDGMKGDKGDAGSDPGTDIFKHEGYQVFRVGALLAGSFQNAIAACAKARYGAKPVGNYPGSSGDCDGTFVQFKTWYGEPSEFGKLVGANTVTVGNYGRTPKSGGGYLSCDGSGQRTFIGTCPSFAWCHKDWCSSTTCNIACAV